MIIPNPLRALLPRLQPLRSGIPGSEFFRYHGIWAPGVRLMRRFSVRSKVITLTVVLCLAMAPSLYRDLRQIEGLLDTRARDINALMLIDQALSHIEQTTTPGRVTEDIQTLQSRLMAMPTSDATRGLWQNVLTSAELAGRSELGSDTRQTALDDALTSLDGVVQLLRRHDNLHPGIVAAVELGHLSHGLEQLRLAMRQSTPSAMILQAQTVGRLQQQQRRLMSLLSSWSVSHQSELQMPMFDKGLALTLASLAGQPGVSDQASQIAAARNEIIALRHQFAKELLPELRKAHAELQDRQHNELSILLASVLLMGYFIHCFYRAENGGMRQVMVSVDRLARGDLRGKTHSWGSDEVAQINEAMNRALSQFAEVMMSMSASASAVCQASEQVASGNESLRGRNQSSVSHVDGLADAVSRYKEDVHRCHQLIEEVANHVQSLQLVANRTRRHMLMLQEHMLSLRTKSGEISEIVRLMDAIAFRTNVLALNASVEASKAGEAGRGFAVVAQEVRSLATRSAQSASRINSIVATSIEEIDVSSSLASEASTSQQSGDEHVAHLQQAMQEVVTLTTHGMATCENLSDELRAVKDDLHQNQSLVDQLSEASKCLHQQGQKLNLKSRQFSLD